MPRPKIFLSAVSRQFEPCRNALASDLRAVGYEVVVQEDFRQHGRTLLEKLEEYIAGCDRMIALVGDAYGAEPSAEARPEGRPRRSYTQWEYAFALGERLDGANAGRKDVFVYIASDDYLTAHPVAEEAEQKQIQEDFRRGIKESDKDRNTFDSLDGLCRLALRDGFRVRDPAHKPIHLPDRSIGTLFKGRDDFLADLRRRLCEPNGRAAAIVAPRVVHGLGGVGKTRAAIEYAWRFAADYTALLFVSAPTPDDLHARLADLTTVLAIKTAATEVDARMNEVLRWLDAHPGWLLIVDNVDTEPAAAEVERLLARLSAGHVLITSRLANWSRAVERLELHVLTEADAVAFLLERTGNRLTAPDDPGTAATIARELGGLALALEQVGAYIETQHLGFAEYLARWQAKKADVLRWHDPRLMRYPASVAVTWETTFAQLSEAERRLLEVLSWLAPEPIPLALFEAAALAEFIPEPRTALAGLAGYSLARFAADVDAVTVHRLVQEITRTRAAEPDRAAALRAALEAVDDQVPFDTHDVRTWERLRPLVPHAAAVARHADSAGIVAPTARLMNQLAIYLQASAQYSAAETLFRRALAISEASLGPDHPNLAAALNNLAGLLRATNRLAEAEPLFRRALVISEASYGPDHPDVARDLNNLASLLRATNRHAEAEPLYRRVVTILEASLGEDHPNLAAALNNLAGLLQDTNRPAEAEPLFRRALAIDEASYGLDHPAVAIDLNNLAELLRATGRRAEAEPLSRRQLEILLRFTHATGHEHPHLRDAVGNYAGLLADLGQDDTAIRARLNEIGRPFGFRYGEAG
ncbi:MAG TPA: tetratricopeptide repeat protein [Isosphaeraceae bacterium]|jgi:tetratricopeptide (TPR) repeat protein|nr:tetratricopeptide repeat protein [Isosphaeraceae bacterium]